MVIESYLIQQLKEAFNLKVVEEVPEHLPSKFILVTKTGGSRKRHVYKDAFINIQCFDVSAFKARELSERVNDFISDMQDTDEHIIKVSSSSESSKYAPLSNLKCYQSILQIKYIN